MKPFSLFCASLICLCLFSPSVSAFATTQLRFNSDGRFKMLQISDMHYGENTCLNIPEEEKPYCNDLNTTSFLKRTIASEKPDLIVFSGDNIYGLCQTKDAAKAMDAAFAPAIESGIPWLAILGNHDQESDMTRETLMKYIVKLPNTLSQVNPIGSNLLYKIDGFGNYNLQILGPLGSPLFFKSLLNLYMLDGGDYTPLEGFVYGYDWVRKSQIDWYEDTSKWLEREYKGWPWPQNTTAPGLVFLHIPMPEFKEFTNEKYMLKRKVGVRQEDTQSPQINSGLFTRFVERGDVKGVFSGHDHVNDFCGKPQNIDINLCYAGGGGYGGYGRIGFARRIRIVEAHLKKSDYGTWGPVDAIKTWKRLDDKNHTSLDTQLLWSTNSTVPANFRLACSIKQH